MSKENQVQKNEIYIEPDRVNSVVEGYFRIPAVWVGNAPLETTNEIGMSFATEVIYTTKFDCGIKAYAMRNGLFLFDFLESNIAGIVRIPGYEVNPCDYEKIGAPRFTPPKQNTDACRKSQEVSVLRAQIMNAHQACLASAEIIFNRGAGPMGYPVTAKSKVESIGITHAVPYHNDFANIEALARNVLDGKYGASFAQSQRTVLDQDVVMHSFGVLNQLLQLENGWYLPIVETAYQSACRSLEFRFGESIAIGWTACEQLISKEWKDLLEFNKSIRGEGTKMSGDRKKKLLGRDYTASIMTESLELHGRLTVPLYENLEIARKARNNWAHDMKVPSEEEVRACQDAIKEFLARKRIGLQLQAGHIYLAQGVSWNLPIFQQVHGKDIPGFMS